MVFVAGKVQGGGAEGLSVLGRGECTVIDKHELIKDEQRHLVQLSHVEWVDMHEETVLGPIPSCNGMGKLTGLQWRGVENDLARIPDAGTVSQEALKFGPADVRSVFGEDLSAAGGGVVDESLSENSVGGCGEGFWLWERRRGPSILAAGCKDRVNAAHGQKTRRPESFASPSRWRSCSSVEDP
jgi:hypothetical protein